MTDENYRDVLKYNIEKIRENMLSAAEKSGRKVSDVVLCAASKTRTAQEVALSAELSIDVFGENRVNELCEKTQANAYLGKSCHLIGQLQTNKVRKTVGTAELIQSVDSLHLAEAIQKEAARIGIVQKILLEVNIGGEASKSGIAPELLPELIAGTESFRNLEIMGLMTVPPKLDTETEKRECFAAMYRLFDGTKRLKTENYRPEILSMGMSGDYCEAIAEGSTMVRIGSAIYGPRFYPQSVK